MKKVDGVWENGLIKRLLSVLFPRKCIFCRIILNNEKEEICPSCARSLPYLKGREARTNGAFFNGCISALLYEGLVRRSVIRYKFGGKSLYARPYADILAETIRSSGFENADMVTWVPVGPKRLRKRGYDQARLLAEACADKLNTRAEGILVKKADNPPQSGLKSERRRANVLGVYSLSQGAELAGRRVLLIDDVVTTGATFSECARVLLTAGAAGVSCASLAKTPYNKKRKKP